MTIKFFLYLISAVLLSTDKGPEISVVGSVNADSAMHAAGVKYVEENITNSFSSRKLD